MAARANVHKDQIHLTVTVRGASKRRNPTLLRQRAPHSVMIESEISEHPEAPAGSVAPRQLFRIPPIKYPSDTNAKKSGNREAEDCNERAR
jgi:hypothetical protein